MEVKLSVALLTRNRPAVLNSCLQGLRSQSLQPYEVIISDDSEPEFQPAVRAAATTWHCKYIVGPKCGLYANRNSAAIACSGTHIRTMDDDHVLPPGHLAQCLEAVKLDPKCIWTTGEKSFVNGSYYGTTPTAYQLHPSGLGSPIVDPEDNWAIADGSTIYPAEVFKQGHRMVEWYGYGSSYLEFGAYLYSKGFKSRCIPGALVEHWAEDNTLKRTMDTQGRESQLYASLCFNLYFKPNMLLALRYTLSCIKGAKFHKGLIESLPTAWARAKKRWT